MHLNPLSRSIAWTTVLMLRWFVYGAPDLAFDDDSDLTNFVTRPEIRMPLFNVETQDRDRITPGYWFIAPYGNIEQEHFPQKYYQPCQTGPAIYDGNGDLVWTGACMRKNINTCDFRLIESNNSYLLSAVSVTGGEDNKGEGIILDSSYNILQNVSVQTLISNFNMHEFQLMHGGKTALMIVHRSEQIELDPELEADRKTGWILNMGFQEVDVETGKPLFEWWAYPEVRPQESKVLKTHLEGPYPGAWNWFHMNSVDKNSNGDYMISSRFTDTIFKISSNTGKVEWRLDGSGKTSDFVLDNFNFSRQHDARWLEHSKGREVISFLDNAADLNNETSSYSSSLIVELDKTAIPWIARVLKRWIRPDGALSRLRGNTHVLQNGNVFTCWSGHSYLSEHSPSGELLMNATFRGRRFVTYRGYKFNFTATPQELPVLKASVYGTSPEQSTTVSHVSWNGATEVSSWKFYAVSKKPKEAVLLGSTNRTGFETSIHTDGYSQTIYAEALNTKDEVLGRTNIYEVKQPAHWQLTSAVPSTWQSGQAASSSIIWPHWHNRDVDSESVDMNGCSVYHTGCEPLLALINVGVALIGKTEL